jgi:hypothetical protein
VDPPRSNEYGPYGPETQLALIRADLVQIHRELDDLKRWRDTLVVMSEALARDICREMLAEQTAGTTSSKDSVMRLAAFAVSIGTAIFVIRGGR